MTGERQTAGVGAGGAGVHGGGVGGFRPAIALVRSSHPEPTVMVTALAMALAIGTGRSAIGVLAVGAAVLAGQLSVGWHNDWLDAARDAAAGRPDKPVAAGAIGRRAVGRAALTALVAAVPLSLASGWRAGLAHLVAIALAWAYNARLKATLISFVPYAVAFPLLVAFVTLGAPHASWPPWWALVTAALLGCSAHLVNVVPDMSDDLAAGVRGLPHRLGRSRSVAATVALLMAATVVESFGPGHPGWWAVTAVVAVAAAITAGIVLARRPGSRWLFRAVLVAAAIDVAGLVARGSRL
ncbi:MAG TPA: UbiA family prenyltransferase [Streptosporangiaceae bacterium]